MRYAVPFLSIVIVCTVVGADPLTEFEQRKQTLLENRASSTNHSPYTELARLATGLAPDEGGFYSALYRMDTRQDTADFSLPAILRLLYKYSGPPAVSQSLMDHARLSLLTFKYWPDEPGIDSMCTWSENHYILFSAGAYLAGQLYPAEVFTNSGKTGAQLMAIHRPRISRWLDLRFRTGFSEWLSNVYYNEDLPALLSLVDLCEDQEIATRAAMVTDLLLLDIALNSFQGVFGSTHGRSYDAGKKWAEQESTTDTAWLLFGRGFLDNINMSATCLAFSENYRMPPVIYAIANDVNRASVLNRQRMGLRLEEADRWGLGFSNFEDGMTWLTMEAYAHPLTIELFASMLDEYNWWENDFFAVLASQRTMIEALRASGQLVDFAIGYEYDMCRNLRDEVNIYTYRTPEYMLSSAPNYRAGYGGDQQHIWQATLGPNAVCFTTHPARYTGDTPNYWTGYGWLPRVVQHENVAIVVHNADNDSPAFLVTETLDFTHAWLPRDQFDEFVEQDEWLFARKGNGYLAFRSQHPYSWQQAFGEDRNRELIVAGRQNVYVCELGRRSVDGEFTEFIQRICDAEIQFDALAVDYHSPSQGRLQFSWSGDFYVNGEPVPFTRYPRYGNPYLNVEFPAETVNVGYGGYRLSLDWQGPERNSESIPMPAVRWPGLLCCVTVIVACSRARIARLVPAVSRVRGWRN